MSQECFDENLLIVNNNNEENQIVGVDPVENKYKYFVPTRNNTYFYVNVKLPESVVCKYCVLQWRYHAGNRFGKALNGRSCLGCAVKQEEFYNCADIEILTKSPKIGLENSNQSNITDILDLNNSNLIKPSFNLIILFLISNFNFKKL